jgi:alpha,alpha-trehalase
MAGTVDLVQRCYTGIEIRDGRLWLNPQLPDELAALCIRLRFRGQTLALDISQARMELRAISADRAAIGIRVGEQRIALRPGERHRVPLADMPIAIEAP